MADLPPTPDEIANATKATLDKAEAIKRLAADSENLAEANKRMAASTEVARKVGVDFNEVQRQGIKLFNQAKEAVQDYVLQSQSLGKVYQSLKEDFFKLKDVSKPFTEGQLMGLSQISNAVSDTTKLYANLGQVNFAMGFSEQYSVIAQLAEDTFKSVKKLTPQAIEDAFTKANLRIPIDTLMKGKDAVNDYIKAQLNAADAGLRLRDSVLTNASATGTLGTVYEKSGSQLTSLNALLHKHRTMIDLAAQATNTAPDAVLKYYSELGKLPGMLDKVVHLTDKGGVKTSMLSATLLLARGAGIDTTTAINSMREALNDYNATGEEAIAYVARMSEMSEKLGLEFDHVRNFMHSTSEALGRFGNNTDATARILNNYTAALRATGASGKQTVDILDGMTKSVAGLNTAQKALLSARSGGPGGLIGSLQIEKLIRDNKTDQLMEMVRKDMVKQFGKVVTLDDAIKDPRLAGQFEKQRAMLQSGPYGKIAKDNIDAAKILGMFKEIQLGAKPEDIYKPEGSQSVGAKIMDRGQKIGDQSATAFGMSGLQFRASQNTAALVQLEATQGAFAVGSGSNAIGTYINDPNREMKENIRMEQDSARAVGANRVTNLGNENQNKGLYLDASRREAKEDSSRKINFLENNVVKMMEAPINLVNSILNTKPTAEQNENNLQRFIRGEGAKPTKSSAMVPRPPTKEEKAKQMQAGEQATQESRQKVDVHITGFCLACQTKIQDPRSRAVNPSSGQ